MTFRSTACRAPATIRDSRAKRMKMKTRHPTRRAANKTLAAIARLAGRTGQNRDRTIRTNAVSLLVMSIAPRAILSSRHHLQNVSLKFYFSCLISKYILVLNEGFSSKLEISTNDNCISPMNSPSRSSQSNSSLASVPLSPYMKKPSPLAGPFLDDYNHAKKAPVGRGF